MINVQFREYTSPDPFPDYLVADLASEKRVIKITDHETGRVLYEEGKRDLDRYPFQFREV